MLRRYCPPTSNSALVICPSEHTRTVFISSANTLPLFDHRLLQLRQRRRRFLRVPRVELGEALQLRLLLLVVERASSIFCGGGVGVRIAERVDADDRVASRRASCARSTATLPGSCRAGSRSPSRRARRRARLIASNSFSTASSTRSVSSSMMKQPWFGFSFFARPHSRLMIELDRHRAAHALLGRRGDRLVVGVGVQRVGVVVGRDQRLQRGADVVERDLLRVQAAARRLGVVLELLRALVGAVAFAHRHRPDAARDAADHRVLGVHAVAEEERQVRREVVDVHAAREVRLDEREAVRTA